MTSSEYTHQLRNCITLVALDERILAVAQMADEILATPQNRKTSIFP